MFAEIITIGDEILIGQVIDTNSAWIAEQLNLIGFRVKQITSVSDDKEHIMEALGNAELRADLIILTGGLGPTRDDKTKEALSEFFNSNLFFNEEAFKNIERIFNARGLKINAENRKQAELPDACIPLINYEGTAFGMWFENDQKVTVSLPGVPYEMKHLITNEVIPRILKKFKTPCVIHKTVITQGIGESFLAELIERWENDLPEFISLAYLPSPGSVKLRLSAVGENESDLRITVNQQIESLEKLISRWIIGYDEDTLEKIIGQLLATNNKSVSTAESCTGGYISQLITSVPGSSGYYTGSIIAYANSIKIKELGIDEKIIEEQGAVSREVSIKMANSCRIKFKTDYSIGVTGVAGPTGGSPRKPVGTAWIAIASVDRVISQQFLFGQNRGRNIIETSLTALNMLRKEILKDFPIEVDRE